MYRKGLVSVITPTWQRSGMLLGRCIPSVQAQTWPRVEHIIVSDGPDPALRERIERKPYFVTDEDRERVRSRYHPVIFDELAEHAPSLHWGGPGRRRGIELALGEFIAYVDDDDSLRPDHCRALVGALKENKDVCWAYSKMASHQPGGNPDVVIGDTPLAFGSIGTPMIMHTRVALDAATWGEPRPGEDWELVAKWLEAGLKRVHVDEVTIDVWPSTHRNDGAYRDEESSLG